jgi:hypothetical protein
MLKPSNILLLGFITQEAELLFNLCEVSAKPTVIVVEAASITGFSNVQRRG